MKTIAFKVYGDYKNQLINMNFIYCFWRTYAESGTVDIYSNLSDKQMDSILDGCGYFCFRGPLEACKPRVYALVVDIDMFCTIAYQKKINMLKNLRTWIRLCLEFQENIHTSAFFDADHFCLCNIFAYAKIKGRNRVNIADHNGLCGVEDCFSLPYVVKSEEETLRKYGLDEQAFVTIHRDTPMNENHTTTVWPKNYYEELVDAFKERWPDVRIVNLTEGENEEKEVGRDCSGCYDMEEIKVLLKHALLHIDGNSDLVFMRRALHKWNNLVIYGAYNADFYACGREPVIRHTSCPGSCEGLHGSWSAYCPLYEKPQCLWEITPKRLMEIIAEMNIF